MAQKRRKPKGVTSFISDALKEQQRARQQTEQATQQASLAWAKEEAKVTAARKRDADREKVRTDRQTAREQEIAAGQAEAEALTRVHQARITELETLLRGTLDEDPYISFDDLKEALPLTDFQPPEELVVAEDPPSEERFLPSPPTGLGALAPGRKRSYAAELDAGRATYRQALAEYEAREQRRRERLEDERTDHVQAVTREQERVRRQHEGVEQWADRFAAGDPRAVREYFTAVLGAQRYPADFPTTVKAAYRSAERMLVVDIDLPLLEAIPELASCDYQPYKKAVKDKPLTQSARKTLYQDGIAQIALRTLRSVFVADRTALIARMVCNGYVDTINKATGRPARWCLVSVDVTRELFDELDLAQVEPLDCLSYLHAKVSRTPEKCTPVQPIIDYPWDDLPYSDELDAVSGLDSVKNLLDLDGFEFERLMVQLFEAMSGFDEVRRTRSRGDGGIDLVAVNKTPFVGGRVAIQAKRYAPHRKVDIAAVREIVGSTSQRDFTKGVIITTSGFTSAARDEATRLGVELYDNERLLWLLRQHLHRDFTIIDEARRKPPFKKPPAP